MSFQQNRVVQIHVTKYCLMKSFLLNDQLGKNIMFPFCPWKYTAPSQMLEFEKLYLGYPGYLHLQTHSLRFHLHDQFCHHHQSRVLLSLSIHLLIYLIIGKHHPLSIFFSQQKIKISAFSSVFNKNLQRCVFRLLYTFLQDDAQLWATQ